MDTSTGLSTWSREGGPDRNVKVTEELWSRSESAISTAAFSLPFFFWIRMRTISHFWLRSNKWSLPWIQFSHWKMTFLSSFLGERIWGGLYRNTLVRSSSTILLFGKYYLWAFSRTYRAQISHFRVEVLSALWLRCFSLKELLVAPQYLRGEVQFPLDPTIKCCENTIVSRDRKKWNRYVINEDNPAIFWCIYLHISWWPRNNLKYEYLAFIDKCKLWYWLRIPLCQSEAAQCLSDQPHQPPLPNWNQYWAQ